MENSALTGRVHSFQSMGAVDGPGLRYVVFFQGCPLRCAYCHNPDTWAFGGGQQVTVEDVLQKVRRCAPYIKKNGGVTLTGGEPLAQSGFAAALLAALKAEGFHTAVDTSGAASLADAEQVLAHTDLVLADLKFTTEEDYRRHTGGSLAQPPPHRRQPCPYPGVPGPLQKNGPPGVAAARGGARPQRRHRGRRTAGGAGKGV